MNNFYSTSEARKILSELMNQVKYQGKSFKLGRNGEVEALLTPVEQGRPNIHKTVESRREAQNANTDYTSPLFTYVFQAIAKKYDLDIIVLFGSHAKGKVKPTSDLDIAIKGSKPLSRNHEQEIFNELVPLLSRDDIDIVNLDHTHDVVLRYNIFSEGKIIFEKSPDLHKKCLIHAYFEYQDFQKYLKRYDELLCKKLNNLMESTA